MALSFTAALMTWLGLPHIAILFIAVVLVVVCAFAINRVAGIPVPWWRPPSALTSSQHE